MRRFFQLSLLGLAVGSVSSCKVATDVSTENIPTAGVRFINAVPDSAGSFGLDMRFTDLVESNAQYQIKYRNGPSATAPFVSTLIEFKGARAGSRKYKIFLDDTLQSIAQVTMLGEQSPTLVADHNYTVMLWGYGRCSTTPIHASCPGATATNKIRLDFFDETVPDPGAGKAAVRVYNATENDIEVREYACTVAACTGAVIPATPNIITTGSGAFIPAFGKSDYLVVDTSSFIMLNVQPKGGGTALFADARALPGAPPTCSNVVCVAQQVWSATATYLAGALVNYQGDNYSATVGSTGVTPGTDKTKWNKLAKPDLEASPGTTAQGSAVSAVVWPKSVGAELAPTAPTLALAGVAGNVDNGPHSYKVSYVTAAGENGAGASTANPIIVVDKTVNGQVNLTGIPLGSSSVIARKIYRTTNIGAVFLLVGTINNNTATTFTDNVADASLGAAALSSNTALRAPQTADFAVPAITFMWDRRPARLCTPLC